jgi:hypothetical protein
MKREIEDSHAITTSKLVLETAFSSQRLPHQRRTLGARQRRILAVLETGSFSLAALMRHLGARSETERGLVHRSLRGLAGQGIVRIVGRDDKHDLASTMVELVDSRAVGPSYRGSSTFKRRLVTPEMSTF